MKKSILIKGDQLEWEPGQEPPLMNKKGIGQKTVDDAQMSVNRTYIPPGARNQRHYHANCNAVMFVLKGQLKMFFGPDDDMEEVIAKEGDFVFAPVGAIHGLMNMSDTEPAELVTAKCVNNIAEQATVFVEPPWV